MVKNDEVAARLEELADLLEAQDVEYKPRAYRDAAENVLGHAESIESLAAEGLDAVTTIEGVGEAIGEKLIEYVETGSIEALDEQRAALPVDMTALTRVEGVGPRTVGTLYEALGIRDLDDLEAAAEAGEIREVPGFGAKTEQNILERIPFARAAGERTLLEDGRTVGEAVRTFLDGIEGVDRVALAGSIRRFRPTIGDVDVLVATRAGEEVVDAVAEWDRIEDVIESGDTKTSLRIDGLGVDIRLVAPEEFGSALQYFTGSREHNVTLRNRAIDRELKINEYGVFEITADERAAADTRAGTRIAGETEDGVYGAVGLPWIPPELREDRGEIAAAAAGDLPDLLEPGDLCGDLHVHTDYSDGDASIEKMLEAAVEFGHDYVAITDHAAGPGVFGNSGLTDDQLRDQLEAVRSAAESVPVEVFTGVEANVDVDGTVLETDPELLAELDVVVASPHSNLGGDDDQTDRLLAAIEQPAVNVLGHPSGRLLNQRPAMEFDPVALGEAAAAHDVALEVNANPHRLDLWGRAVQVAVKAGATIVINTDAHAPTELSYQRFGLHTARRGWAEPADVLNAWPVADVRGFLEG
ncbi:MAG: DNA polymerase/3'-5' exonuclease PolX [Halodesulfurarchaeum sp.]